MTLVKFRRPGSLELGLATGAYVDGLVSVISFSFKYMEHLKVFKR